MHEFKSIECITNEDEATNYPIEFLNALDVPTCSLPPYNLRLKVGPVVIVLRNINQPKLYNSTRLVVSKLMNIVIYATILKGKFKGEEVLILRIPMIPSDMPLQKYRKPTNFNEAPSQINYDRLLPNNLFKRYQNPSPRSFNALGRYYV